MITFPPSMGSKTTLIRSKKEVEMKASYVLIDRP